VPAPWPAPPATVAMITDDVAPAGPAAAITAPPASTAASTAPVPALIPSPVRH
jgi:hypothetical protein